MEQLEFEVDTLWHGFRATNWYGNPAHFPNAHYRYMMALFARVDLLSRYWPGYEKPQTRRMAGFLDCYVHRGKHDENCVAVQLWRHTVMHTAEARQLLDTTAGRRYTWRYDFGQPAPPLPHYTTYHQPDGTWVLVVVLTDLVADLKRGQALYLADLDGDAGGLQAKYASQDPSIRLQQFRSAGCR